MDVIGAGRRFVATAVSDRQNLVMSDDGKLRARLDGDVDGRRGVSPEQVFAAGFAACVNRTIIEVARARGLATGAVWVTARVVVPAGEGGRLRIEVVADIAELSAGDAEALVRAAFDACPVSAAMRGNIDLELRVA
ncbi:MAG TPA: OsmC family protein [Kofleriaceae bacterium]|jgi:Ohr subfamily peroxiredoxin|nr:OsmC family protein [Kofleriaceae bacterium]